MQFGTDLFSSEHDQVVAFRNQDFITPNYTSIGGTIYNNSTGQVVTPTGALKKQVAKAQAAVNKQLNMSDALNEKNLLRFYTPKGFKKVNSTAYNYSNGLEKELAIQKKLGLKSTSMYSKNRDRSLEDLYKTDAPEATHSKSKNNRIEITNPDSTSGN